MEPGMEQIFGMMYGNAITVKIALTWTSVGLAQKQFLID
jgi:hypothetical protein